MAEIVDYLFYPRIKSSRQVRGFTIVELLIVIVVIGILAAIVIVAFNGVQARAQNTQRINEIFAWQRIFEVYKAQEGEYPAMPSSATTTGYCLGVGFLQNKCRDYKGSGATTYLESDAAPLMAQLRKVAALPSPSNIPARGTLGPYAEYSDTQITIAAWIKGLNAADCPAGTTFSWSDGTGERIACKVTLRR